MHGSDDYEFVTVEELGWSNPYNPNTHKGDHQTIVFVSVMHSWIYGGGGGGVKGVYRRGETGPATHYQDVCIDANWIYTMCHLLISAVVDRRGESGRTMHAQDVCMDTNWIYSMWHLLIQPSAATV